jgi:hypothetical protein
MKRILLVYFSVLTLVLSSCFDENKDACMTLKFSVHDEYLEDSLGVSGDFDSRIGNDILLTAFQGGKVVSSSVIPYESIHNGECTVKKPDGAADGEMTLVAWGIPKTATGDCYQPLAIGTAFDSYYIEQGTTIAEASDHVTGTHDFHEGSTVVTNAGGELNSEIVLNAIDCKIRVIVDGFIPQSIPPVDPIAEIVGTAVHSTLAGLGTGGDAVRTVTLHAIPTTADEYSTDAVSVMPSKDGQSVSVRLFDGNAPIVVLSSTRAESVVAQPGDYIVFHYNMETASVDIKVNDWTVKGEVAKM